MAISRRPAPKTETVEPDVNIEALIAKGGSVPQEIKLSESAKPTQKEEVAFTLRIPGNICSDLDTVRMTPYKTSRQQWVIEAIVQRLAREKESGG